MSDELTKVSELLNELDGTRAARVAMLAEMTREELDSVGGVEEDGESTTQEER